MPIVVAIVVVIVLNVLAGRQRAALTERLERSRSELSAAVVAQHRFVESGPRRQRFHIVDIVNDTDAAVCYEAALAGQERAPHVLLYARRGLSRGERLELLAVRGGAMPLLGRDWTMMVSAEEQAEELAGAITTAIARVNQLERDLGLPPTATPAAASFANPSGPPATPLVADTTRAAAAPAAAPPTPAPQQPALPPVTPPAPSRCVVTLINGAHLRPTETLSSSGPEYQPGTQVEVLAPGTLERGGTLIYRLRVPADGTVGWSFLTPDEVAGCAF